MDIIIDGRVIQDHFPGIARYTYNLLATLPGCLQPGDTLQALRLPAAPNVRYNWSDLCERGVLVQDYPTGIFKAANLLRQPQLSDKGNTVIHFPYYMRPYRMRQPSVTTIHDLITFVYPQMAPNAMARLSIRLFNALAVRTSRAIIAVSRSAAQDLERCFPAARGRIAVIYEAADAIFAPQPRDRIEQVLEKYKLPPQFALFLASNKPHKNLARLMDAWQIMVRDWKLRAGAPTIADLQSPALVVAGHRDPRYTEAERRAQELGIEANVKFIGAVSNEDMPALYSACSLFVFPSLYEGFGLPPLEAMACGAPLACSKASSLPEVAGNAALLFDPLRPDDIAAACRRILTDTALQSDLRRRSVAQAACFSWSAAARSTIDVYRSILR